MVSCWILWKMTFLEDWLISCIWLWPWKWTRFWKSCICFVIPNDYINKTFINESRTYIGKHFLLGQFESLKMEIGLKFGSAWNINWENEWFEGEKFIWKKVNSRSTVVIDQSMGREGANREKLLMGEIFMLWSWLMELVITHPHGIGDHTPSKKSFPLTHFLPKQIECLIKAQFRFTFVFNWSTDLMEDAMWSCISV